MLPDALVSAVNAAEVVTKMIENGFPDGEAWNVVSLLPMEIVPFGSGAARAAGLLHRHTRGRGISLGDRACLSLAGERGLPAITGDQVWMTLGLDIEIQTLR